MIIGFTREVDSLIKAAIALKRHPQATLVCGRDKRDMRKMLSMYSGEIIQEVDDVVKGVPAGVRIVTWSKPPKCGSMMQCISAGTMIEYAIRHREARPAELASAVSLAYPDMMKLLSHDSEVTKRYYGYYREVMSEINRMKAHTRLREGKDALYVEIYPEHLVHDLYLEWAERRSPDRVTVVKCHREYYLVNAKYRGYNKNIVTISDEEAARLTEGASEQKADDIWKTYYDSQFIEGRRNKAFASKMLPKKYAYLSPDVKEERKKIERSIPGTKLDDFMNV